MPSAAYHHLSDADVGVIVAYIRSVAPVNRVMPANRLGPLGRFLVATGNFPDLLPAALIDRSKARPPAPAVGPTAEYGAYLGRLCQSCHLSDFTGGLVQGPGAPPSANLTPAGNLKRWSREEFITAMRTGRTPERRQLDSLVMPWRSFRHATDDELTALYLYVKSVPAKETVVVR